MSALLLTSCFMFMLVVLSIGVIYSRAYWLLKAILISTSLGFAALFYYGYTGGMGYPVSVRPPSMFRFIYGFVREPLPTKHDDGAIYVWLTIDGNVPRAIEMPYSTEKRKMIAEAKTRVQQGETVYMGMSEAKGAAKGNPKRINRSGNGETHKSTDGIPYEVHGSDDLQFRAPPDTLPRKDNHD